MPHIHKCQHQLATCPGFVIDPDLGPGPCGAQEGQLHRLGCDKERCTQCSGQFLYCDCPEPYEQRERVPFFDTLGWLHCHRCDMTSPKMFHVADEAWKFYVLDLGDGDKYLCVDCFNVIAELRDGGACLRRYGAPIMIDDPDYHRIVDMRHALSEQRGTINGRSGRRGLSLCHEMEPIYIGTLNDKPLRFYPPQADDDLMPWVAMDDLAGALGMNRTARKALARSQAKFPDLAKRVRADGRTIDVLAFQGVQGLMGALKQAGRADDATHFAFMKEIVHAAEIANPMLFDRDSNGELRVASPAMAMLLGEDHSRIVDRIRQHGLDAQAFSTH